MLLPEIITTHQFLLSIFELLFLPYISLLILVGGGENFSTYKFEPSWFLRQISKINVVKSLKSRRVSVSSRIGHRSGTLQEPLHIPYLTSGVRDGGSDAHRLYFPHRSVPHTSRYRLPNIGKKDSVRSV